MGNTILNIHVKPCANRNKVVEVREEFIKIDISAPPERNRANIELINFLKKVLGVDKNSIKIIRGGHSKIKTIQIDSLNRDEVINKLKYARK